jgi:hypothetical protein
MRLRKNVDLASAILAMGIVPCIAQARLAILEGRVKINNATVPTDANDNRWYYGKSDKPDVCKVVVHMHRYVYDSRKGSHVESWYRVGVVQQNTDGSYTVALVV